MSECAVELLGVGFQYGARPALVDFELRIPVGSWSVCLGLNGAGKSTLLRIIAGLLRPSTGRCLVFGVSPKQARDRFLFLAADDAPLPATTVRELLLFSVDLFGRRRPNAGEQQELFGRFGLVGLERRPLSSLSRGQLRRAELLALRAVDPDLWLLDEPHSGLDAAGQDLLIEECGLARARGKTLVVASHTFLELASVPDQVLVLRNGALAWQGDGHAVASELQVWNWSVQAKTTSFEPSLRAWAEAEQVQITGPTAPTPSQILQLLRGRAP